MQPAAQIGDGDGDGDGEPVGDGDVESVTDGEAEGVGDGDSGAGRGTDGEGVTERQARRGRHGGLGR